MGALAADLFVIKEGNQADIGIRLKRVTLAAFNQGLHRAIRALQVIKPGRKDKLLQGAAKDTRLGISHAELKVPDLRDLTSNLLGQHGEKQGVMLGISRLVLKLAVEAKWKGIGL